MYKVDNDLKSIWKDFQISNPTVRIRDAAQSLGVSEAELLATECGDGVTRIAGNWGEIIQQMSGFGSVMALTRNESAVHEKHGHYRNIKISANMGLVLDEAIDLRLFLSHWQIGYAVEKQQRSFQFFDATGTAIHKIYLNQDCDQKKFYELVTRYKSHNQSPVELVEKRSVSKKQLDDKNVDIQALRNDWLDLEDTHDFFAMLKRHNVTRTQAFRLAGEDLAKKVSTTTVRTLLERAAKQELPVMIFVGNVGIIQIHTGLVRKVVIKDQWLNILDPDFNLHLRQDLVDSVWVVKKPTLDGTVTSVELYDKDGENIALIFGKRKPGQPELDKWRELVAEIE